jgi:DNA-binding winged helix-turn-helix (wHTH) protein
LTARRLLLIAGREVCISYRESVLAGYVGDLGKMPSPVTQSSSKRVQFGSFEADLGSGELRRSGIRVRLQSQPFRLLALLVERQGELVSREVLQAELWGNDTTVNFDHSIGMAVNKLREALGDSAENPRFIETLARRGYRFIAPVQIIQPQSQPTPVNEPPGERPRLPKAFWPGLSAVLVVLCILLGALLLMR